METNQILNSLDACVKKSCNTCDYRGARDCQRRLLLSAANLIKEQEKQIEKYISMIDRAKSPDSGSSKPMIQELKELRDFYAGLSEKYKFLGKLNTWKAYASECDDLIYAFENNQMVHSDWERMKELATIRREYRIGEGVRKK